MLSEKLKLPFLVVDTRKMDFIIDESEVFDEFYSKNSDCTEDESLLDNFIKPGNKCEDEIDSATFDKNF